MRVTIEIDTDNAAFEDGLQREVSRILHEVAHRVDGTVLTNTKMLLKRGAVYPLQDLSGNTVGSIKFT